MGGGGLLSDYGACQYVDDPAEVWLVTYRVAAKPHVCVECDGVIAKGERHEVISSLYCGDWQRDRTCAACLRGPLAFVERNCGTARLIGGLFYHLRDVHHLMRTPFAEGLVERWLDEASVRGAARRRASS